MNTETAKALKAEYTELGNHVRNGPEEARFQEIERALRWEGVKAPRVSRDFQGVKPIIRAKRRSASVEHPRLVDAPVEPLRYVPL